MPAGLPFRTLIYVQHLLGIGHLQRSLQLAAELSRLDIEVELVSGGRSPPIAIPDGVRLRQLPPVYSPDGSFTRLLDVSGNDIDQSWKSRRKNQLLNIFESFAPQALITETFPFGRRMMRFELIPLLEAARNSETCLQTIASIRDVLQPKSKPGREQEICNLVDTYYDHILVHGDRDINRLRDSFSLADRFTDKISYSGYICNGDYSLPPGQDGIDEVLVSAGGSATGLEVLKTAIAAKPLSSLGDLHWRILVSPLIDENHFRELRRHADGNTCVERNRPDFNGLMKRARLSISQAGYNTVTDLLGSRAAAIVIPYAEAGEVEQTLRARTLQERGRLIMLPQGNLTATSLAAAIEQACQLDPSLEVNLTGAATSAAWISKWLQNADAAA